MSEQQGLRQPADLLQVQDRKRLHLQSVLQRNDSPIPLTGPGDDRSLNRKGSEDNKQTKNERKVMKNQFDELTKGLAQSVTRRAALKRFGVGLAGMALSCFLTVSRSPAGA